MYKKIRLIDAYREDHTRRTRPGTEACVRDLYRSLDIACPDGWFDSCLHKFGLVLVPNEEDTRAAREDGIEDESGYWEAVTILFPGQEVPGWESFGPIPPAWQRDHTPVEPSILDQPIHNRSDVKRESAYANRKVKESIVRMEHAEREMTRSVREIQQMMQDGMALT